MQSQDPQQTVIEGEEKHHDDKSAMSKVKDKVKKLKSRIDKWKQDDGKDHQSDASLDEEVVEEEEDGYKEDDDPKISSAPIVKDDLAAPKSTNPPARDPPARASEPQRVSIGDAEKFETEKVHEPEKVKLGDVNGNVKEDPASPKSTNSPARALEPQRVSIGDAEMFEPENVHEPEKVQLGNVIGDVKEDPASPKSTNSPARGGEEIGLTPVIQSFEAISVSNDPKPELKPKPETQPSDATGSTDHPTVSYTEKLKSMATTPAEYGKNIASTVYDKISIAGSAVAQKIRGGPTKEVDTETNREVSQDKATNREVSQDKAVSVKEYISEKLKPGEEDQALSEVISEAVQRSKEEMIATEEAATAQTRAGGVRMVEKIRGAMPSVVGGGAGSNNTTVASDLHQEKGSHEAADTRMLE